MKVLLQLSRFIFIACCLAIALDAVHSLIAKPDLPSPPPKKEQQPPPPDVAGFSNWGFVKQEGKRLTVEGNTWAADDGEIREDGMVVLEWYFVSSGKRAVGVYRIEGKNFQGHWGWREDAWVDEDGQLAGRRMTERIYKLVVQADP